jgi:hypothetical protein
MAAIIAQRWPGASSGTNLSVWRSCVEPLAARYPFPNTPGPTRGIRTSMRRVPGVCLLSMGDGAREEPDERSPDHSEDRGSGAVEG